jgi:hypothetical protein
MYKALLLGLLAAVPSSTNFTLEAYDFGTGSGAPSSSNYNLQASLGAEGGSLSSGSYGLPPGIRASSTVSAPAAPTFTNPDNSYNRLRLTLNASGFPSDVTYLIAISDDNFVTTQYVQTDQTIGPSVNAANYQSYATWGGAGGFWVLGLDYGVTYKVKVAALQGQDTGGPFGPSATAATVQPSVTFAVSTSLTGSPPFNVNFTSLTPGSVVSANATVLADITTNALNGGGILIKSQNAGLTSSVAGNTIASATADLASAGSGYGAQVTSTSQTSGGPFTEVSPFDGTSDNVGGLTAALRQLASFPGPIDAGNVTTTFKAKATATTPSATDYSDNLTISLMLLF